MTFGIEFKLAVKYGVTLVHKTTLVIVFLKIWQLLVTRVINDCLF